MRRLLIPVVLAFLAVAANVAPVAAKTYEIDPVHSTILFRVGHMGAGEVFGFFREYKGAFDFDPAQPVEENMIEVTVKTESLDTLNAQRDEHLRTPDFFDTATHPEISFKSSKWEKSEDGYKVTGDLTFMGVTKEVAADAKYLGTATDPRGDERLGLKASLKIKRSEFGMDKMIPGASDEVELIVSFEGIAKPTEAAPAE